MRINIKISDWLKKRGRSVMWLSKRTDKNYRTIWELANKPKNNISLEVLARVCVALECTPGDLLALEEGRSHKPRKATTPKGEKVRPLTKKEIE